MYANTAHPPMELCDCLNDCGDDLWIYDNKVIPCTHFIEREQRKKERRYALYLELKDEFEPKKRKTK